MNKKSVLTRAIIAVLVVAVVILLAVVLWPTPADNQQGTGVAGVISEDWDTGLDEGGVTATGIQVPGYTHAKMSAGDETLHLNIGNPKENSAAFYATVQLEDGTVLYKSPLLEPGQGISDLPLQTSPTTGTYQAYVVYQIVSLDDAHTPMNSVRSAFTLYVE